MEVTALILTYNEKENIARTLPALDWLDRIVVIDSFSTDETIQIARSFTNVEVLQHEFVSFAAQCNWGLSQIATDWVLSLDADYLLTEQLIEEMGSLSLDSEVSGYRARFKYCVGGVPLRTTLLPPRTVLYRKAKAIYADEGHGHRVTIAGPVKALEGFVLHDDRKPLSRWLASQDRYMQIEAPHLRVTPDRGLSFQDRLRKKIVFAPPVIFLYLLFGRGLILDGWRGWYYVAQRALAELLLSLRLVTEREKLEPVSETRPPGLV